MSPFLNTGDCVHLRPANSLTIKKGDILLAKWQGKYVLHRFIRMKRGRFVLAGDRNLVQLENMERTQILGVVVMAYRRSRVIYKRSNIMRCLGLVWYATRMSRRVWVKMRSLIMEPFK